ncbi:MULTISPECIES: hypothetical protein [unclassified Pseudomonas]|jgi:hypothetical protein|uniref:hypothetical protein n=1 Tax=unclassified Pseudomonas TaxID=196821 RepID=UPI0015B824CA|nr:MULTISPECIES: hypothetical protein [unclassified Pseudomonas]MCS4249457.1 hypothetical protein [Pseudomonas sp. BIGb0164]NWE23046.1 hypothetical protein [Pseudomonas sp. P7548]
MEQLKVGAKFINYDGFVEPVRPIITPAENTTGIVLRTCYAYGGKMLTGTVTPVPTNGEFTAFPIVFLGLGSPSGEVVIPAGQGLWWAPVEGGFSPSYAYTTYDDLA